MTNTSVVQFAPETIKAATIIVTILPIICVYPFIQKYFVKGLLLGGRQGSTPPPADWYGGSRARFWNAQQGN